MSNNENAHRIGDIYERNQTIVVLVPSLVLLPLWFVLVGRLLSRKREYQQAHNDVTELR